MLRYLKLVFVLMLIAFSIMFGQSIYVGVLNLFESDFLEELSLVGNSLLFLVILICTMISLSLFFARPRTWMHRKNRAAAAKEWDQLVKEIRGE